MKARKAKAKFERMGLHVRLHPRNHLRIIRYRDSKFMGPRVVAWWPESQKQTAHDVNLDCSWAPATYEEVLQCVQDDEGYAETLHAPVS